MNPKLKKWLMGFMFAVWGGAFAPLSVAYVLPSAIHFDKLSMKAMGLMALAGAFSHVIAYCEKSPFPGLCDSTEASSNKS